MVLKRRPPDLAAGFGERAEALGERWLTAEACHYTFILE